MTKENAHKYLPLVQALADGKQLEYRDGFGAWGATGGIDQIVFEEDPSCYRIKPEPRTFEMWLTPMGSMHTSSQMSHAPWQISDCERITVQEVLK